MGLFYGVSLLTKSSTYFILLVPPLIILVRWRWDILRKRALWLAPAIATCLYLPWLLISRSVLLLGIHGLELPGFFGIQRIYLATLWNEMSFFVPLAFGGAICVLRSNQSRSRTISWCMLSIFPATSMGIFVARVPVQGRLLMLSYAAIIFLAAEFWTTVAPGFRASLVLAGCLAVFAPLQWMHFHRPPADSYAAAVEILQSRDANHPGAVLVPSGMEGPWIAEFAETEQQRPLRILVRPTKIFGEEDWNGSVWHPYYHSTGEFGALLQRLPVKYCILSESSAGRRYPHDAILKSSIGGHGDSWRMIFESRTEPAYQVYENTRWTADSEAQVYSEVSRSLHGILKAIQ